MIEPPLNQEDHNNLHEMLTEFRQLKEGLHHIGEIPGKLIITKSDEPDQLWTECELKMFTRFNAHTLNYTIEEN